MLHKSKFFDNIGQLLNKHPNIDLKDMFSKGQMDSKRWLVDTLLHLDPDMGTVFLCGGWYGSLATFLLETNLRIEKIRSFDIDPSCADIADILNKSWVTNQWQFKAITQDIYDIDYESHTWQCWSNANNRMSYPITDVPTTIINTSCEHLSDFAGWYSKIPKGRLVIIQANDFHEVEEHVNTYNTIEEFSTSAPMSSTLYEGELELLKYKRFMKIGFK